MLTSCVCDQLKQRRIDQGTSDYLSNASCHAVGLPLRLRSWIWWTALIQPYQRLPAAEKASLDIKKKAHSLKTRPMWNKSLIRVCFLWTGNIRASSFSCVSRGEAAWTASRVMPDRPWQLSALIYLSLLHRLHAAARSALHTRTVNVTVRPRGAGRPETQGWGGNHIIFICSKVKHPGF